MQLKRKHNAWQSSWFLEAAYSIFRNNCSHLLSDKETCQQERVLQQIQAEVQASLPPGQYNQWAISHIDPVVSELSVVRKYVMWRRTE